MIEVSSTEAATTGSQMNEVSVKEVSAEVRERLENRIESVRRKSVFSYRLTAVRNNGHAEREPAGLPQTSSQNRAGRKTTR